MVQMRRDTPLSAHAEESVCRLLAWLADAERQMQEALAQTHASSLSCQQALAALAKLRSRIESSPGDAQPTCVSGILDALDVRMLGTLRLESSVRGMAAPLPAGSAPMNAPGHNLSPREIEVLVLIAAGHSNKEIALRLCLSVRTVERHINNIYRKIDAQNKADATAYALRHHLA